MRLFGLLSARLERSCTESEGSFLLRIRKCQKLLAGSGIVCSMCRRLDVRDNSAMESFFASLKKEGVHRRVYATRQHAKAVLFYYV